MATLTPYRPVASFGRRFPSGIGLVWICGLLCGCINSKSKSRPLEEMMSPNHPPLADSTTILDDMTYSLVTAETLVDDGCPVNRAGSRLTPDVAIRIERECIVANNVGEFGMRLSFHAVGDDVEHVIVSSIIDNIIAFARVGKTVLAIASVRHLNGRIFELTRENDGWSSKVLSTLPGDVVRVGEDERTGDVVLLVNDLEDRSPASAPRQLMFRCDRLRQVSSENQPAEASFVRWIWPAH
jgi:hypothetical protein